MTDAEFADALRVYNSYHVVDLAKRIIRGPRPTAAILGDLHEHCELGAVLDLEGPKFASPEEQYCKRYGIEEYLVPMSQITRPRPYDIHKAIDVLVATKVPILVHCHQGVDRTGIVCAAYRVWVQKWPVTKAWDEMMQMGFHRWRYFFWLGDIRRVLERELGYV